MRPLINILGMAEAYINRRVKMLQSQYCLIKLIAAVFWDLRTLNFRKPKVILET
jgi:hypothetical protein